MAREFLTDEQVEEEIDRLRESPLVKLARRERRLQYKRRQFLYSLRELEKHGKNLQSAGITLEMLDGLEKETQETEI
jgi:DNA-binding transcriptional ArsR family regulator